MIRSRKTAVHNKNNNKSSSSITGEEYDDNSSLLQLNNNNNNSSNSRSSSQRNLHDDNNKGMSHNNLSQQLISHKTVLGVVVSIFVLGFLLERMGTSTTTTTATSMLSVPAGPPGISLIPSEEDEALAKDPDGQVYHVIFSTDCGTYQHWQSYLTFFRAMKVKQPGHVTRIASGCTREEKEVIEHWFANHVQHMSQRFHLLLTPKFSEVKDETGKVIGEYPFFNKPHGLKYWLEHSPLMDFDGHNDFPTTRDDIVILIDPDMSILRPITKDFTSDEDIVIAPFRKNHIIARTVAHGKPFAQTYGFASQFLNMDLEKIDGPDSPLLKTTHEEGRLYYPVGPPYIATATDAYKIALKWTEFVPKTHAQYPHLLAEMFAFSQAAISAKLPHQLINSLMVSDTHSGNGEGWPLIDRMPADQVCQIAREADHTKYGLPYVVHLCQRYSLGKDWFFGKRRIPHDVFDCPNPLFEEPPDNVGTSYDYKWPPNAKEKTNLTPEMAQREAFMLCHLTTALNEAAEYYKRSACASGQSNLKKSKKVADLFRGHT